MSKELMIKIVDKNCMKIHSVFWTIGCYDLVFYTEGPDERTAMSVVFPFLDLAKETLVAITKNDTLKAIGV